MNTSSRKVSSFDHLTQKLGKLGIQVSIVNPYSVAGKVSKGLVTPVGTNKKLPVVGTTSFNNCSVQVDQSSCKMKQSCVQSESGFAYSEEKLYMDWRTVHTLNLKKALQRKCPSIVSLQKQSEIVWKSDDNKIVQLGLLTFRVQFAGRSPGENDKIMVVSLRDLNDNLMDQVRKFLLSNLKADVFWEGIRFTQDNCMIVYNYDFSTRSWNIV